MKSLNNSSGGCPESFTDQSQDQQSTSSEQLSVDSILNSSSDLPHVDFFRPTSTNPKPIFKRGESILLLTSSRYDKRIEELVLLTYTDLQIKFDDVYIFTDNIKNKDFNNGLIESQYKNITDHLFGFDAFQTVTKKIGTLPKASHLLIIECLYDKPTSRDFMNIICRGSYYGMTIMMIVRSCLGVPLEIRSNFDHIIIDGLQSETEISYMKRIYDNYLGMFPSFSHIRKFQQEMATDDVLHVIKTNMTGKGIIDRIKVYPMSSIDLDRYIKFFPAINTNLGINTIDTQDLLYRINKTIDELVDIRNIIKNNI